MADPDKELRIKITTAADTTGIRQTLDALKTVSVAAKKGAPAPGEIASPPEAPGLRPGDAPDSTIDRTGEFPPWANTLRLALNPVTDAARLLATAADALNVRLAELTTQFLAAREHPGPARDAAHLTTPDEETGSGRANNFAPLASSSPASASGGGEALELAQKINGNQTALLTSLAGLLQQTFSSTRDMLDLVRQGQQAQAGLRNEIADLRRSLANLANARGNPGTPTPP